MLIRSNEQKKPKIRMPYEDKGVPRTGEKVYKHSGDDQISQVFWGSMCYAC